MTEPRRPDARCKDCPTPSACGHYAECLRTIIRRPAGDAAPLPASDEVLEALEKAVGALDAGVKISAESVLHDMLRAALRSLRGNKT